MHLRRIVVAVVVTGVLATVAVAWYLTGNSTSAAAPPLAVAALRGIRVVVSTNGIVEPVDRVDVVSPIDGFVTSVDRTEGSEVKEGQVICRIRSDSSLSALAEAKAAFMRARAEARPILDGPQQEELTALDASIAQSQLQLSQAQSSLKEEEALFAKQATTRYAVENLRKQVQLLQSQTDTLMQKKSAVLHRHTAEEKTWEQDRLAAHERQIALLEDQIRKGTVNSSRSGIIYSLSVRPGSYVSRGQALAQLYEPGNVRIRAYVDEPDLGSIKMGQSVAIQWDGLPGHVWTGSVSRPAKDIVPLGNRSVGHVLCVVHGQPQELIPNSNVRLEIVTAEKKSALVVPRSAVTRRDGAPAVLVWDGKNATPVAVTLGLVTPEEVEIAAGISAGQSIVLHPAGASQ